MLTFTSIALAMFTSLSFASDNTKQIAAISQEIQALQEKLTAANNKIEKLCDCTITKNTNTNTKIDVSKIHQTANGRH
ncbi:MAG: hypothetical protein RLZZ66_2391 [Pseudomonadota bacterium]